MRDQGTESVAEKVYKALAFGCVLVVWTLHQVGRI